MRRQWSSPNLNRNGYVELASLRSPEKWWRTPEASSEGSVASYAARPSRLSLFATEVTQEGQVKQSWISRSELIDTSLLSPQELRQMLLFGGHHNGSQFGEQHLLDDSLRRQHSGRLTSLFKLRRGVLILSIGSIRAIVERNRVLLFERSEDATQDSSEFLNVLVKGMPQIDQPQGADGKFQLYCADQALLATIRKLDSCLLAVREVNAAVMKTSSMSDVVRIRGMELEHIRQQRLIVLKCLGEASHVASILLECLNSPDDMLLGELDDAQTQEWVAMLELYLQAYGECADECKMLLEVIENCEGSAHLEMQERRLHIEEFELILVIAAVSVAAGALVPGIWGMNLRTGFEESKLAFYIAILVTVMVSLTLFTLIRCVAGCRGIFL